MPVRDIDRRLGFREGSDLFSLYLVLGACEDLTHGHTFETARQTIVHPLDRLQLAGFHPQLQPGGGMLYTCDYLT